MNHRTATVWCECYGCVRIVFRMRCDVMCVCVCGQVTAVPSSCLRSTPDTHMLTPYQLQCTVPVCAYIRQPAQSASAVSQRSQSASAVRYIDAQTHFSNKHYIQIETDTHTESHLVHTGKAIQEYPREATDTSINKPTKWYVRMWPAKMRAKQSKHTGESPSENISCSDRLCTAESHSQCTARKYIHTKKKKKTQQPTLTTYGSIRTM